MLSFVKPYSFLAGFALLITRERTRAGPDRFSILPFLCITADKVLLQTSTMSIAGNRQPLEAITLNILFINLPSDLLNIYRMNEASFDDFSCKGLFPALNSHYSFI